MKVLKQMCQGCNIPLMIENSNLLYLDLLSDIWISMCQCQQIMALTELKIEKLNMSVSHHMSKDFSILDPFALKPFKDGAEIFWKENTLRD